MCPSGCEYDLEGDESPQMWKVYSLGRRRVVGLGFWERSKLVEQWTGGRVQME